MLFIFVSRIQRRLTYGHAVFFITLSWFSEENRQYKFDLYGEYPLTYLMVWPLTKLFLNILEFNNIDWDMTGKLCKCTEVKNGKEVFKLYYNIKKLDQEYFWKERFTF